MIRQDVATESPLFGAGVTVGAFEHVPVDVSRGLVVTIAGHGYNGHQVTAIAVNGKAMTEALWSNRGVEPYPYAAVWVLDEVPAGPLTIEITKEEAAVIRATAETIVADGAVAVDVTKGASSESSKECAITLEPTAAGIAYGVISDGQEVLPASVSKTLVFERAEGGNNYVVSRAKARAGFSCVFTWNYAAAAANARAGVVLKDPNPPAPGTFTENYESGDLFEEYEVQAIMEGEPRVVVESDVVAQGKYAAHFEVRPGDKDPATGKARAEVISGLSFASGDSAYFRMVRRIKRLDNGHWVIFWQLHDASEESPPLAVLCEGGKMYVQQGAGKPRYLTLPMPPLNQWFELVIWVKFHATEGEIKVWLNGVQQRFDNGEMVITGANTLGVPNAYDKRGIYASSATEETIEAYEDDYRVTAEFFSEPPKPRRYKMLSPEGIWRAIPFGVKLLGGAFKELN